jgi:D-alanine-D-alanine ligase-like ATP-grasp enzyme
MKVAILYDAGSDEWSPQDVAAVVGNVHEVRDVLRRRGHEVELLPVRLGDFRWLSRVRRVDLVFNLCEGINGHARYEEMVVGTLELAGVPFTGCRTWPTTICHRKHVANTLLAAAGLPVPAFTLAQANKTPGEFPLPAIVKPSAEDVRAAALAAYHALDCRDWCRIDIRCDAANRPMVVELNPLPGILPDPRDNSCFPKAARAAGMGYDELIRTVADIAWRRISGRSLLAEVA